MTAGTPGTVRVQTSAEILALTGRELGPSAWLDLTQDRVDDFARVVDDWHWAHNEPEVAARGPFGGPAPPRPLGAARPVPPLPRGAPS